MDLGLRVSLDLGLFGFSPQHILRFRRAAESGGDDDDDDDDDYDDEDGS